PVLRKRYGMGVPRSVRAGTAVRRHGHAAKRRGPRAILHHGSVRRARCYCSGRGDGSAMTERKPPGTSWETWIEAQIRVAMEQGAFDNLPGAGKPLPNLDQDPDWWV